MERKGREEGRRGRREGEGRRRREEKGGEEKGGEGREEEKEEKRSSDIFTSAYILTYLTHELKHLGFAPFPSLPPLPSPPLPSSSTLLTKRGGGERDKTRYILLEGYRK
jgi:hypothetical protein